MTLILAGASLRLQADFNVHRLHLVPSQITLEPEQVQNVLSGPRGRESRRVAMVSRKVFCGANSPLITGILLRVDWVLLLRRPGAAFDSCSDPKLGRKREVPGAHPRPWRSAPIRDTRGDSTLAPRGL
ncbi:hypothetical protein Q8A73_009582 [Channa argus]|nr:hypothetical protein Q8A73_009582 [Channa argus]